jgi:hypothetical protein
MIATKLTPIITAALAIVSAALAYPGLLAERTKEQLGMAA